MDFVGEGEGGMIWENGIEICIISYMKRVTSRGFLYFHTNCEIICSSSVKNTAGSLIGIALNL